MIRLIIFCILISPTVFFFDDFKIFLVQVNPLTDWETLTHFVKVYLFPVSFLTLFIFSSNKPKLLANSMLLVVLCIASLFLLNISNREIMYHINGDSLYFTVIAYCISLYFFFHASLYSLFTHEKYTNLALTFIFYNWWFIYMTELMFNFEVDGFVASGSLVLANTILLFSLFLIIRVLTLRWYSK